jgi:uncharacterized protein (DUF3084 family)
MRPRTTAEVLTALAGALIPLVTILIVLAVSADARQYILHYNETIKQRDALRAEVRKDQQDIDGGKTLLKATLTELDGTKNSLVVQRGQLKTVHDELGQSADELKRSQRDVAKVQVEYKNAQERFATAEKQYAVTKQKYAAVQKAYVVVQKNLTDTTRNYAALKTDYQRVFKDRDMADLELKKDKQEIETDKKEIAEDSKTLDDLKTQLNSAKTDLDQTRESLAETQDALTSAQIRLEKQEIDLKKAVPIANQLLLEPIVFNVGDEVARVAVPGGLKEKEAAAYVDQLMDKASEIALQHGAVRSAAGGERAAGFIDSPIEDPIGSQIGTLTTQDQYDQVVAELVQSKKPSVLVARALYNMVKGRYVPIYMERKDNPLVFKKDQPIADTVINGDNTRGEIFEQVETFLRDKVAEKAKESKMVPVEGSDEGLGSVSDADMLNVVEIIHQRGQNTRLIAVAIQDTYAGDRLALDFKYRQ